MVGSPNTSIPLPSTVWEGGPLCVPRYKGSELLYSNREEGEITFVLGTEAFHCHELLALAVAPNLAEIKGNINLPDFATMIGVEAFIKTFYFKFSRNCPDKVLPLLLEIYRIAKALEVTKVHEECIVKINFVTFNKQNCVNIWDISWANIDQGMEMKLLNERAMQEIKKNLNEGNSFNSNVWTEDLWDQILRLDFAPEKVSPAEYEFQLLEELFRWKNAKKAERKRVFQKKLKWLIRLPLMNCATIAKVQKMKIYRSDLCWELVAYFSDNSSSSYSNDFARLNKTPRVTKTDAATHVQDLQTLDNMPLTIPLELIKVEPIVEPIAELAAEKAQADEETTLSIQRSLESDMDMVKGQGLLPTPKRSFPSGSADDNAMIPAQPKRPCEVGQTKIPIWQIFSDHYSLFNDE